MSQMLRGIALKKLDFELTKAGDLYYFEGPFLSHFIDERGQDYLMNWVDINVDLNKWILFSVNSEKLNDYFSKKASLRELVYSVESGAVYFLDINSKAEYEKIHILSTADIPDEYLPKPESFFDPIHSERYALELARVNKNRLTHSRNSFMNRVMKKLFVNNKVDLKGLSIKVGRSYCTDPNFIDETAIGQSLLFPLMIHYHKHQNEELKDLILNHALAFTGHDKFKTYLNRVNMVIFNTSLQKKEGIDIFFSAMIESTVNIVKEEPRKYGHLYNDWLDTIKVEYKAVDCLYKVVKTKRKFDYLNKLEKKKI